MKPRPISVAAAGLAVALCAAGAAAANGYYVTGPSRYVTTYRPVTHYVRRTVVVRERVWRPVLHRVHYRRYYAPPTYAYGYGYEPAYFAPRYDEPPYGWRHRHWRHERWEHERWEHRHG